MTATPQLIAILRANIGHKLTPEAAADICIAADALLPIMPRSRIEEIEPEQYPDYTFAIERIEDIGKEIRPLHWAHWKETEEHRHGLPFDPDYKTFIRYEQAGRYILFTLRAEGILLGNCAMYLTRSAHTQTLMAKEDTLYLLPKARRGQCAKRFVAYVENSLRQLGVMEINITVKRVNRAGRLFRLLGYRHVEDGLTKLLEAHHA